jgi:hypothetical protein
MPKIVSQGKYSITLRYHIKASILVMDIKCHVQKIFSMIFVGTIQLKHCSRAKRSRTMRFETGPSLSVVSEADASALRGGRLNRAVERV